jgi:hypothetical protein
MYKRHSALCKRALYKLSYTAIIQMMMWCAGFNLSELPEFKPHHLLWLLGYNGVVVIANIRYHSHTSLGGWNEVVFICYTHVPKHHIFCQS